MLEWGSGASTLWYSQFVKQYYSIEHTAEWYDKVSPRLPSNVKYHLSEVRPGYKGWPGGFSGGSQEQFANYIDEVHKLGLTHIDRVLVDGRARAHCAIAVIPYLTNTSRVFMHDYFLRPHYRVVLEYFEEEVQVMTDQSLVVLRLKSAGMGSS